MKTELEANEWGRLHVNRQCCGAATCRNFAPQLLGEVPSKQGEAAHRGPSVLPGSYEPGAFTGVVRQPQSKEEFLAARTAAAACPFGALRLERPAQRLSPSELGSPWREWPRRLEDNVWVLGHTSADNFGALPYFIELPGGGVLVDVPKPSEELFRWLEEHGGVRWLLLTHRDHVHHHVEYAKRFPGCRRVIGAADVNLREKPFAPVTSDVEIKLGNEPVPMTLEGTRLKEEELATAELVVLPQPGHTPGTLCLLYRGRFLFTGDHLSYSRAREHLLAHRLQCWEDWGRQSESVQRLVQWAEAGWLRFTWILPGHGEWHRFENDGGAAAAAAELRRGLEWMRSQVGGNTPLLRHWVPFVMSRTRPHTRFARFVRAIGGESRETWLLPRGLRHYLNDHEPAKAEAAVRRAYALVGASLVLLTTLVWLGVRAVGSLLTGQ